MLQDQNTKLQYRLTPPAAFPCTAIDLTIIISNETGSNISFSNTDHILITIPPAMVTAFNFKCTPPTGSGLDCAEQSTKGVFKIYAPFSSTTIKAGDQLKFIFAQVPVNETVADLTISIEEEIGGTDLSTNLGFEIKSAGLNIIAWLDDLIVAQYQSTYLNWTSSGASSVTISGFPTGSGSKEVELEGKIEVYVPQRGDVGTWPYKAIAFSGSKNAEEDVTLQQNPPVIYAFDKDPNVATIAVDEDLTLSWNTQYASSVLLTTPTIPNQRFRIPANPVKVSPGKDLVAAYKFNWSQLPTKANYILTANGFYKAAAIPVSVVLAPVKLAYFKYESDKKQVVLTPVTIPADWGAVEGPTSTQTDVVTFKIFQPGGTVDTYYLGDDDKTHPQVQVFLATENGGKYDLQWETANCKSLVLNPGSTVISAADIAKGTISGKPAGTYTLTGTSDNGETVDSVLVISANEAETC